jgi:hypothetical protein
MTRAISAASAGAFLFDRHAQLIHGLEARRPRPGPEHHRPKPRSTPPGREQGRTRPGSRRPASVLEESRPRELLCLDLPDERRSRRSDAATPPSSEALRRRIRTHRLVTIFRDIAVNNLINRSAHGSSGCRAHRRNDPNIAQAFAAAVASSTRPALGAVWTD